MSDLILDGLIESGIQVHRYALGQMREVGKLLDALKASVLASLAGGLPDSPRTQFQKERMGSLLQWLDQEIKQVYSTIWKEQFHKLGGLATVESIRGVGILNGAMGVDLATNVLTTEQARALASRVMVEGSPAADWWKTQGDGLTKVISDQIRLGVGRGETTDQIIQRIYGKGKGAAFVAGVVPKDVFDNARRNAEALVRTSVQTVANTAHLETFKLNGDVIEAVEWVSTLDNRTTPICRRLDGLKWKVEDWEPMGHSINFPGPVAHWGCRSTQVPVTYSWADLVDKFGGDKTLAAKMDAAERKKGTTRASMFGPMTSSGQQLLFKDWAAKLGKDLGASLFGSEKAWSRIVGGAEASKILMTLKPLNMSELVTTVKGILSRELKGALGPALDAALKPAALKQTPADKAVALAEKKKAAAEKALALAEKKKAAELKKAEAAAAKEAAAKAKAEALKAKADLKLFKTSKNIEELRPLFNAEMLKPVPDKMLLQRVIKLSEEKAWKNYNNWFKSSTLQGYQQEIDRLLKMNEKLAASPKPDFLTIHYNKFMSNRHAYAMNQLKAKQDLAKAQAQAAATKATPPKAVHSAIQSMALHEQQKALAAELEKLRATVISGRDSGDSAMKRHQMERFRAAFEKIDRDGKINLQEYTGSYYTKMNKALRADLNDRSTWGGNSREWVQEWKGYAAKANRFLDLLPDFEGQVTRGIHPKGSKAEIIARYRAGAVVEEKAFTSSSYHRMFASDADVRFHIMSKHGKQVDWLSEHPGETEVLFKPGTKFKVLETKTIGGKYIIVMEEV